MTNQNRINAKEKFLSTIEGVNIDDISGVLKENTNNLDLYTYFVSLNACNTGTVNTKDIKEHIHKLYADWYFLNRNNESNESIYKLTHQSMYQPQNITEQDLFELIASNKYKNILPIKIQFLNKLEEKYFVSIDLDKLYAKKSNGEYTARLYLNMPSNVILDFVKEFIDRAYLSEWSGQIKYLNQDDRSDSIIVYTDFEYVEKVVAEIEDIIADYSHKFENIGEINPLLGKASKHVGFGENPENNKTYFYNRCEALNEIENKATIKVLKDYLVNTEKKVIFRNDNLSFTPSEYLAYLIEKNATAIIDAEISKLKAENNLDKVDDLKETKNKITEILNIENEVNNLKKSLTRKENYTCTLENFNPIEFDYLDKLYTLFNRDEKVDKETTTEAKKKLISAQIFKPTEEVFGENTQDILQKYFQEALKDALQELIDNANQDLQSTKSSEILTNLKQKHIDKLKKVLQLIIDNNDEGKEYLNSCIYDYIRLLSSGAMEDVTVYIDSNAIKINTDINQDIVSAFPEIKESIDLLSKSPDYINNILLNHDINMNDLCVNKNTRYLSHDRSQNTQKQSRFYYDPEHAL